MTRATYSATPLLRSLVHRPRGVILVMDPDTIRSLRSGIQMDLLPYCEVGSMIPVDLSPNCDGWIYDLNGSGIQILGIRSRDPFSGSTDRTCLVVSTSFVRCSWKAFFGVILVKKLARVNTGARPKTFVELFNYRPSFEANPFPSLNNVAGFSYFIHTLKW